MLTLLILVQDRCQRRADGHQQPGAGLEERSILTGRIPPKVDLMRRCPVGNVLASVTQILLFVGFFGGLFLQ